MPRRTSSNNGNGHAEDPQELLEQLPPHDPEAEQGVLGCILMDPIQAGSVAIMRIGKNTEAFFELRNRTIYEAMVSMVDMNEPIDQITLSSWLRFAGQLEGIGGLSYLNELEQGATHPLNIGQYVDTLLEHWSSRQLIVVCTETVRGVMEHEDRTAALIDTASQRIFDLGHGQAVEEEHSMAELLEGAITTIQTAYDGNKAVTGISTGFTDLDIMTTGLHAGEFIIIAGRPGRGKSTIAMNIAEHVAVDQRLPVGVFSLEMTAESLILRMLCARARVNYRGILQGYVSQGAFPRLASARAQMVDAPLVINDTGGLNLLGLRARARRMHQQHGLKLLIIDYVQLLSGERRYQDSRQEEMTSISAGVKSLAKELEIPVIALSQLNRQVETERRSKPRLSDIRSSGSLEQDADLVAFLYAPAKEEEENEETETQKINLYIAKQRNGPIGEVGLVFLKQFTRFVSAATVAEDDVPSESAEPELVL